jgi:hypothetical protein
MVKWKKEQEGEENWMARINKMDKAGRRRIVKAGR